MNYDKEKQEKIRKQQEKQNIKKMLEEQKIIDQIEKHPKIDKFQINKFVERMEDDANRRKLGALKLKLQLEQSETVYGNMETLNKDISLTDKISHKPKNSTEHSERLHMLTIGGRDPADITFNNVLGNQSNNQKIKGKKDVLTKPKESVTVSQTANSIAKLVIYLLYLLKSNTF